MVCYECPTSLPLINSPMLLPNLLLVLSLTHSRPRLDLLHGRPSCGDMIRIYNQVEKVKGENQGISKFEYFGIFVVIPFIFPEPRLDTFVFYKSKGSIEAFQLDDSKEVVDLVADDLYILRYNSVNPLIESGQIDLV
ncbi:hypothetical protein CK203_034235 [Vitis vinifera]|uniref:DNA replication complex GINS protein SLD5 C-terminal domain-containing protein n=1 Tax=Vitis vinifera TaxID=29760 RepID=A0A438IEW9_VITVI|nr:hypothetical protein CK203_034235 [Vitis vinifera]